MKRVFIIHGWSGSPEEGWFPWLKTELVNNGFQVEVPTMPNTDEPEIQAWVSYLSLLVGEVDEETFFVGHSIGCQTIIRFLETLPENSKIGGCVFVGGWFELMNLETEEELSIAKPWLERPIDFSKVKSHNSNFTAIFSDDDPVVPLNNKELFESNLNAKTIIEHNKGHFSGSDGITEVPEVLEIILKSSLER